jgi:hypothetical protein
MKSRASKHRAKSPQQAACQKLGMKSRASKTRANVRTRKRRAKTRARKLRKNRANREYERAGGIGFELAGV